MEIRVLGPIEVHADGAAVSVGGPRQRRIVAALALQPNEVVSVDRLAEITWTGEELPQHSERNVRTYVHRIRTAVGEDLAPRFATAAPGYLLNLDPDELDAARFELACARSGRLHDRGDSQGAIGALDEALELWRGQPYAEFADEDWARTEVSRLGEVRAGALELRCEVLLHLGRGSEALPALDALIDEHPLRERPRGLQMQALYHGGRQAEALRAFQDYRSYLIDEAGVSPTEDLVELDRAIAAGTLELSGGSSSVRGYEVHELIGTGAFADVHRGTQPSLGREVAIKSVKAELANRPEFIRGFEAEAAIVSRLEHPYIVPLYDFWREPDRAYLVMRWLTGGSLETRLDAGPLSLEHAAQMVEQVGSALAVAHRAGVVHRDVKSANILLDHDGNSYLTDFGIAVEAAGPENPAAALSEGSPAYASPEQLRREQVGPAADVFGLAIATFEALTGELPFADAADRAELLRRQLHDPIPVPSAVHPGLPAGVDEVLATATAKDPGQRYQDVNDFVVAFVAAAADTPAATPGLQEAASRMTHALGGVENPYRGLRAFDEADAGAFFGRDRLVNELLAHLGGGDDRDNRFLAVVGPSGSGKSSVVRAGVVPSLRSGSPPGSDDWFITTMTPGSHPFESLETALLRIAVNPPTSLLEQLEHDRRGIVRGARRILPTDDATAVLVIDQFEELFTQCESEEARTRFLEGLTTAAKDPSSPLRLLITLRADFYDQPLRYEGFAELLKAHAVTVTPLAADELEQAIVRPAESVGAVFEPGLVAEIVADVSSQPGALPLMQYALTELFEARVSGMLMVSTYRELGGLSGALARRAEELYSGLDGEGQLAARRVFGRLVTLGEGSEDTRRRVTRSELGSGPATNAVVDTYGRARLLSFDRDAATREPTVEVAHEALIREWPRLREWLDEDRHGLRLQRSITAAAGLWISSGRDDGDLLRGGRLEAAVDYEGQHGNELNADEREYVEQSRRISERDAARKKRRSRVLAGALAASGVLLVVALIAGLVAVQQRNDARDTRFDSDVRRIVAQASNQAATDRSLGLLLASLAYDLQPSVQTLGGLQSVLVSLPSGWLFAFNGPEPYVAVRVADDDGLIVARHESGVDLFGAGDGLPAGTIAGATGAAVDTSAGAVAMGGSNGAWQVAALPDGQLITEGTADAGVTTVAFDHSGSSLAVGTSDGQVSVVDLATGAVSSAEIQLTGPEGQPTPVTHLAWSLSDARLIAGGGAFAAAIVVDAATGDVVGPPLSFESFSTGATSVGFDGEAAVIVNGPAVRFDEVSFEPTIVDTEGELINLAEVHESDSGGVLVSDGEGRISRVDFDAESAEVLLPSGSLGIPLSSVAVDNQFDRVVFAAPDGRFEVWSLVGDRVLAQAVPREGTKTGIDPAGRYLAEGNTVPGAGSRVWDLEAREVIFESDLDWVNYRDDRLSLADQDVQPLPDGRPVALWSAVGGVTHEFLAPYQGMTDGWSPELGLTAMPQTLFGTINVIDPETGEIIVELDDLIGDTEYDVNDVQRWPVDLEFDPAGEVLLGATIGGRVVLWDTASWDPIVVLEPDIGFVDGDYSADGTELVALHADGFISRRDPRSLEVLEVSSQNPSIGRGNGLGIAISDSGETIANFGQTSATLWDAESLTPIGDPFPHGVEQGWGGQLAVAADRLVTLAGSEILVWNVDTESWRDLACAAAGRNLTRTEWEEFGPEGEEYRATCPQYPSGE